MYNKNMLFQGLSKRCHIDALYFCQKV